MAPFGGAAAVGEREAHARRSGSGPRPSAGSTSMPALRQRSISGSASPRSPSTTMRVGGGAGGAVRGAGRSASARMVVETAAGSSPETAGFDQLLLEQRRRVARIAGIRGVDRAADRQVHVEADQVDQLERSHAEAAGTAHHGIDRRDVGGALGQRAQRLAVERAGDAVDDEAGRRAADSPAVLPQASAVARTVSTASGALARPRTTSTSAITGAGLKKCMPTSRSGLLQPGGERRDRQRRGVAGEDRRRSRQTTSRVWNRRRLAARSSTIASITRPAGAQRVEAVAGA